MTRFPDLHNTLTGDYTGMDACAMFGDPGEPGDGASVQCARMARELVSMARNSHRDQEEALASLMAVLARAVEVEAARAVDLEQVRKAGL